MMQRAVSCLFLVQLLRFVTDRSQRGGVLLELDRAWRQWALTVLALVGFAATAVLLFVPPGVSELSSKRLLTTASALSVSGLALIEGLGCQVCERGIWYGGTLLRWERIRGYTRGASAARCWSHACSSFTERGGGGLVRSN